MPRLVGTLPLRPFAREQRLDGVPRARELELGEAVRVRFVDRGGCVEFQVVVRGDEQELRAAMIEASKCYDRAMISPPG